MMPFRFGVLSKGNVSAREWRNLAKRVERRGYSTLLIPDHIAPQFAPIPAAVAAADATTALRVGTLVLNCDVRPPALVARDAATVDILSGGRFELGLGCGWMRQDYLRSGLTWERGRDRVARFREALIVIDRVLRSHEEGGVSVRGRHWPVHQLATEPRPVQPRLPLLIGAGGPQMIDIAASSADIVSFTRSMAKGDTDEAVVADSEPASLGGKADRLRRAAGKRYSRLEINILTTHVCVGKRVCIATERAATKMGIAVDRFAAMPATLVGDTTSIIAQLRERRERFGISYVAIPESALVEFTPVVEALSGT